MKKFTSSPKCKMKMVSEMIKNIEQENIHYFELFIGLAKEKNKYIGGLSQPTDPENALQKLLLLNK